MRPRRVLGGRAPRGGSGAPGHGAPPLRWAAADRRVAAPPPRGRSRSGAWRARLPGRRRWTSEQLDAAEHAHELRPSDRVWVNLDAALDGLGSASCGPEPLPRYRLAAAPRTFAVRLSAIGGGP
ncbi:beta-galactosidase small subunit-related protein [Marinitenerispora sediminis]|uniref:Beta galactosidase small chain/ domain-containing protein n=1 Tax=Marinitenerispora sediminis TaxID=1931232 RepID=A0A368SZ05_9ACTN|nr:hypothetical protein [Marinitenerispora sediminis]RCV47828.1 hypothetical protein DEF28_25250 [Marinitenerispora sediminis]RCV48384.1 hypothetical protein DEF23_25090 [Marinitenerispora sediminis]RCV50325.1 hypothetical protein DEF24_24340 [Marinitenerispora sediminis]